MSNIVRFNLDEVFSTDSEEYEILYNAAQQIKGVSGAVLEIGTRRGGSARLIIDALKENNDTQRAMFCIDPYGKINFPYTNRHISKFNPDIPLEGDRDSADITVDVECDYSNNMRKRVIPPLHSYAYEAGLDFAFFKLEDTEFFKAFPEGVPVYDGYKTIMNTYALVFFDGPHSNKAVKEEVEFFVPRSTIGSVFVFDDIEVYDHDKFEKYIQENGFELLEKGNVKASYKRVR